MDHHPVLGVVAFRMVLETMRLHVRILLISLNTELFCLWPAERIGKHGQRFVARESIVDHGEITRLSMAGAELVCSITDCARVLIRLDVSNGMKDSVVLDACGDDTAARKAPMDFKTP